MSKIIKLGEEVFGWVKKHMEILLMIIVIVSLFLSLFLQKRYPQISFIIKGKVSVDIVDN